MKKYLLLILFTTNLYSQSNIDLNSYRNFLSANLNLTYDQLKLQNEAGSFTSKIENNWEDALYSDSITLKYDLTKDEIELIKQNGFVVSERLALNSFSSQLASIFHKDLPVFISSDAILHAFHRSYDAILKSSEFNILIPKLKEFLEKLQSNLISFSSQEYIDEELKERIKDLDIYLTVPLKLLDRFATPIYSQNSSLVNQLISYVDDAEYQEINFFSTTKRKVDFSQFKPRGHYDDNNFPELAAYFKAMMWLGRMELYLIAPNSLHPPTKEDVKRQLLMSVLFTELVNYSEANDLMHEIENVISLFVGDQDNVTMSQLKDVINLTGLSSSADLLDNENILHFQQTLANQPYANQQILSQVLIVDPMNPESLKPSSAFMIFGQRFIIDSYVTGSVVYDKIDYEGTKIKRMLPSTLDILFSLGNDASLQLLADELDEYKYASNLAALRYQVDSFDDEFWNKSIYNSWLNSIRQLNPKADRSDYPDFMQTAAWWQQKMNAQLASWAELRHDNLLYAKQSYTGGVTCRYPFSYVEPIPEFFNSIKQLAESSIEKINRINYNQYGWKEYVIDYFRNLGEIADTLQSIAQKELDGVLFSEHEKSFLSRMLNDVNVCGVEYEGWYTSLYFDGFNESFKSDFIVADYHTAPTDANGSMIGWVKHAGTGTVDLMILSAELPDGNRVAFAGPVSSYHEYTSTNFLRLTDDEWKNIYLNNSTRPKWTNIYRTDENGSAFGDGPSLVTSAESKINTDQYPDNFLLAQNYPNPFNPNTIISFVIPQNMTNEKVELKIFNVMGEHVATLIEEQLPAGNYKSKWEATDDTGVKVNSGVYFYRLLVGDKKYVGKMSLVK